jgi:hypothetical protein
MFSRGIGYDPRPMDARSLNAVRFLIAVASLAQVGCGPKDVIPTAPNHPANADAPAGGSQDLAAAETAAYERAKPVFEKYCTMCHTSKGAKTSKAKLEHFNMDTYPFGGHHAASIGETIREVLGATGKEATMPQNDPGAVKGAELEAIVEWSKAFDRSHAAGLHQHDGHDGHDDHGGHEHGGH